MLTISYIAVAEVRYEIAHAILADAEIQSVYARVEKIERRATVALALLACGGGVAVFWLIGC
jgi:hypothetical protein